MSYVAMALLGCAAGTPTTLGQQAGEVLWRFEMASEISGWVLSVGPDGTIYASDQAALYALNPDGSVKWTRPGLAGDGIAIDFLPDGAIVTATFDTVYALETDGSTRWTFQFDGVQFGQQVEVGPSVGPDGNIYVVSGTNGEFGLGAFSLTPDGDLRWADQGDPALAPINQGTGGRIQFTSERAIFPFRITANGSARIYGYDFDGNQTLFVDLTCTGGPTTDPLNRLLISSVCGLEALEQDGNESYWTVQLGPVTLPPVVGDDATSYTASWLDDVTAIDADGNILWSSEAATNAQNMMAVRQDVGRLVYEAFTFGNPSVVTGVDSETGDVLWATGLEKVGTDIELVWVDEAPTSADGSVVYFATRFTSNAYPGAVYAVRVLEAGGCPADFNGDGALNILDFVDFQDAFTAQDPSADCNGDGALNILDFVCFQGLFQAGCP